MLNQTILITGANGNVGRAVVKQLTSNGYFVIGLDAHPPREEIKFDNYEFHQLDLNDERATTSLFSSLLQKHHTIHAGILLAGGFSMGDIRSTTEADIKSMVDLNFFTAYNIGRLLFSHMLELGYGRLVFVGARPALQTAVATNMIAYAVSKSMLFRLAEILNADAKGKNVVTAVIVPSTVDTPQNRSSMPDADPENWVKPEEIAEVLEFICNDKSKILREPIFKLYNNA